MARWSPLIGSSHSKDYIVWQFGGMASPGVTKVSEWGAVEMLEKEMKNQGEKVLRLALKDEVCTKCYRRTVNILLSVLYFLSPSVSTVRSSQYHRIIFLEPIKNRDCFRHCVNASGNQLQVLFSEVLSSFSCACTSQAIGIIQGLFFCNFFQNVVKDFLFLLNNFFFPSLSFYLSIDCGAQVSLLLSSSF